MKTLYVMTASEHKKADNGKYYGYVNFSFDPTFQDGCEQVSFEIETGKLNFSGYPWKNLQKVTLDKSLKRAILGNRSSIEDTLYRNYTNFKVCNGICCIR